MVYDSPGDPKRPMPPIPCCLFSSSYPFASRGRGERCFAQFILDFDSCACRKQSSVRIEPMDDGEPKSVRSTPAPLCFFNSNNKNTLETRSNFTPRPSIMSGVQKTECSKCRVMKDPGQVKLCSAVSSVFSNYLEVSRCLKGFLLTVQGLCILLQGGMSTVYYWQASQLLTRKSFALKCQKADW